MNSTFVTEEPRRGVVTISLVKEDYASSVEKTLRKLRQEINMPGFRKGMVPAALVAQKYGASVKAEELDKLVGDSLIKTLQENKVSYIGNPVMMPHSQDVEKDENFSYTFRVALAPEVNIAIDKSVKLPFHKVKVDDALIDKADEEMRRRYGKMEQTEKALPEDSLRGLLVELAEDGNPLEGGLRVEEVLLLPNTFKSEEEKAKFADANLHQVIRFNPFKADGEEIVLLANLLRLSKEEAEAHKGDFNFEVTAINHFVPAELGEDFYKKLFGEDTEIKDEKAYREELGKRREEELKHASHNLFANTLVNFIKEKMGQPVIDDETFRPFVAEVQKNNKEEEVTDESYKAIVDYVVLTTGIRALADQEGVALTEEEVMAEMRRSVAMRMASFGYGDIPEELLGDIAKRQLEEGNVRAEVELNALVRLLAEDVLEKVTLEEKEVSMDEFDALFHSDRA